jgi:hypothetical protein
MTDYNLTYYRKTDMRMFTGRRITPTDYRIVDSVTGKNDPITHHELSKQFFKDEKNKLMRLPRERMAKKRKVKMNSKAFKEYLERSGS